MKEKMKELLKEYYTETFTFRHLYQNVVKYEKWYKNKTVIVELLIDDRSDLDLHEHLSSLNNKCEITQITIV